jgi:hypothetical protein
MADCDTSFGGIVTVEIDGERLSPTEANIILDVAPFEVEGMANGDGSPCRTVKPKLFKAEIRFRQKIGVDWAAMMRKCAINVTIAEATFARTHLFTKAFATGTPRLNLANGEVEGVNIEGAQYTALRT